MTDALITDETAASILKFMLMLFCLLVVLPTTAYGLYLIKQDVHYLHPGQLYLENFLLFETAIFIICTV